MKIYFIFLCLFYNTYSFAYYKISWCSSTKNPQIEQNYNEYKNILKRRTTLILPNEMQFGECEVGKSEIWWFDANSFPKINKLKEHIANGGIFIAEGNNIEEFKLNELNDYNVGLKWELPEKNGMFYRSFYLLQSLSGCPTEQAKVLMLRKKVNAKAPVGLLINTHFLSPSGGEDCFKGNQDYKTRSFINILLSFMTTDYKEDQRELPEILSRIRNLGLEP